MKSMNIKAMAHILPNGQDNATNCEKSVSAKRDALDADPVEVNWYLEEVSGLRIPFIRTINIYHIFLPWKISRRIWQEHARNYRNLILQFWYQPLTIYIWILELNKWPAPLGMSLFVNLFDEFDFAILGAYISDVGSNDWYKA